MTGRMGGGATGGGLATGISPSSNRRSCSSQSLVAFGRGNAGRGICCVAGSHGCCESDPVGHESFLPVCFFFFSHSLMAEPRTISSSIQKVSRPPGSDLPGEAVGTVRMESAKSMKSQRFIEDLFRVNCPEISFANRPRRRLRLVHL